VSLSWCYIVDLSILPSYSDVVLAAELIGNDSVQDDILLFGTDDLYFDGIFCLELSTFSVGHLTISMQYHHISTHWSVLYAEKAIPKWKDLRLDVESPKYKPFNIIFEFIAQSNLSLVAALDHFSLTQGSCLNKSK
jgi:hypothetical protein